MFGESVTDCPNMINIHIHQYDVDLILATLNTPPQVDGPLGRLSGPLPRSAESSGPAWHSGSAGKHGVENISSRIPRPLHRRLSADQRTTLVASFSAGIKQKDLALQYGVSIHSVKRLVHAARAKERSSPVHGLSDEVPHHRGTDKQIDSAEARQSVRGATLLPPAYDQGGPSL